MQSVSTRLREKHNYPAFVDVRSRVVLISAFNWEGPGKKLGACL